MRSKTLNIAPTVAFHGFQDVKSNVERTFHWSGLRIYCAVRENMMQNVEEAIREKVENIAVEIKICGITSAEEIKMLNESDVSYAGFVFAPDSRRFVAFEKACELKEMLSPGIQAAAVAVSPTVEFARRVADAGFGVLQIHGAFDPAVREAGNVRIWRAVQVKETGTGGEWEMLLAEALADERAEAVVLDAAKAGSGQTFHWDSAFAEAVKEKFKKAGKPLILAGGLQEKNAAAGISLFMPQIVDVSSGVEKTGSGGNVPPGKDYLKIQAFVRAVRTVSQKRS